MVTSGRYWAALRDIEFQPDGMVRGNVEFTLHGGGGFILPLVRWQSIIIISDKLAVL